MNDENRPETEEEEERNTPLFDRPFHGRRGQTPSKGERAGHMASVALFGIFCAAVAGALALFLIFGEGLGAGSIDRVSSMISRGLQGGAQISSDVISFDAQPGNVIEPFLDGIAVLTSNRLVCYDTIGGERLAAERMFSRPALQASVKNVLAYDRNGTTLLLADRHGFLLDLQWERPIITAKLNRAGWLALVTQGSGYKAVVHVYDPDGVPAFRYSSPEYYITDAAVSPDGSQLAVACAGFTDNWVSGRLRVFDLTRTGGATPREATPEDVTTALCDLDGEMIYELFFPKNDRIAAMTEKGAAYWDAKGVLLGRTELEGRYLQDYSALDGAIVLRTSRGRSGSGARLDSYGWDGRSLGGLALKNDVICQSGGGGYVTLVTADAITVYDAKLDAVSDQPNQTHVRAVKQCDTGPVYLIYSDNARLYKP